MSTSTSKLMIKFSMLLTDKESNEMLNFFYSNIFDEMFFSNYDQKKIVTDLDLVVSLLSHLLKSKVF